MYKLITFLLPPMPRGMGGNKTLKTTYPNTGKWIIPDAVTMHANFLHI